MRFQAKRGSRKAKRGSESTIPVAFVEVSEGPGILCIRISEGLFTRLSQSPPTSNTQNP